MNQLDIFQWTPPSNWYSIYDENASSETDNLSYNYYAFENEHVGDVANQTTTNWPDDAVYPTSILDNSRVYGLRGDENTCTTQPEIPFPTARITLLNEKAITKELIVYPNPFESELYFYNSLNIREVEILDISGSILNSFSNQGFFQYDKVDLGYLVNGVYFLRVTFNDGNQDYHKIIKQ